MALSSRGKARKRGKNCEYACAKAVGGVVVGLSRIVKTKGGYVEVNPQYPPDVLTDKFGFECKSRPFPISVKEALLQAIRNTPEPLIPYVWWYDRQSHQTYIITTKEVFLEKHKGEIDGTRG